MGWHHHRPDGRPDGPGHRRYRRDRQGHRHQQMNWERHHIEVVVTAATGNARRAADLLREHLASVGCDPLAFRIAAMLWQPAGTNDDFDNLASQLPGCHTTPWPCPP
jgi:hypothetical protein